MGSVDPEIANASEAEFHYLSKNLAKLLTFGMKEGSIKEGNAELLAEYIIASTWGFLSRPIGSSSPEQFMRDAGLLLSGVRG